MPDWKKDIHARLATLGLDPAHEAGIVEEMSQHLEDRWRALRAAGESDDAARRTALAELGETSEALPRELTRLHAPVESRPLPLGGPPDAGGSPFSGIGHDLRYAVRMLRRTPAFTAFVVLALALGIGANTAVFTLINTLLLKPLPVEDPARLVALETIESGKNAAVVKRLPVSYLNLRDYQDRNQVFQRLAGYTAPQVLTWSRDNQPQRLFGELVTGNYFQTIGVLAVRGRALEPADDGPAGANPVAVLSYSAWQQTFGGAPDIIGRTLRINQRASITIIGVAPAGFKGITYIFGPDLFLPAGLNDLLFGAERSRLQSRTELEFSTVARLRPGVSAGQAEAQIKTISAALQNEHREISRNHSSTVRPLLDAVQGDSLPMMQMASVVLLVIVGLVLLIACSNAASLFFTRAVARRQEIAVRLALGASRGRVIRQLLTESALLGLLAGVVGLFLGQQFCTLLWSFRPPEVAQNLVELNMDSSVLLFTLFVSLLSGVLFGILPALQSTRSELIDPLKEEARTSGRSRRHNWLRKGLLVGQVSLSLVSLIAAALFLRSIQNAYSIDPGFDTQHLALFLTNQSQAGFDRARVETFYRNVRQRLASSPGVESVTWASNLPLWSQPSRAVTIEGELSRRKEDAVTIIANTVDVDFFRTLGIAIDLGRPFHENDGDGAQPVAIVNHAMASRFWPNQSALGKRFLFTGDPTPRLIIGVARNSNYSTLGEAPQPCAWLPLRQNFTASTMLYVRAKGDPSPLLATVQRELRSLYPQIEVSDVRTGAKVVDQALFTAKLAVTLLSVFGLLALLLAAVGLYGVIAYSVEQRRREIGLRMALGAAARTVLAMVLREGMILVGTGVLIGIAISVVVGQLISSLLFGISGADPVSLIGASVVLLLAALLACYLPALRASRMDPLTALREA